MWRPALGRPWAAAVALHGFNDYRMAFSEVGTELAERGIAVYAYDQRGFGGTAGRGFWHGTAPMVADFKAAVALVRARHPGLPVFAIGESMGGAVALAADGGGADGTVLIAPAVWGASTMWFFESSTLWFFAHTLPWWPASGAGLPITPSDNNAMLRRLSNDPMVIKETRVDAVWGLVRLMDEGLEGAKRLAGPALILYGKLDDIVPKGPTCRMIRPAASSHRGLADRALSRGPSHADPGPRGPRGDRRHRRLHGDAGPSDPVRRRDRTGRMGPAPVVACRGALR